MPNTTRSGSEPVRRGFTLVELMVALVLIDVALLAYAADRAVLIRLGHQAAQRDASVAVAESRLERLRGIGCPPAGAGDSLVAPGLREHWRVTGVAPSRGIAGRDVMDSVDFGTAATPAAVVLRSSIVC